MTSQPLNPRDVGPARMRYPEWEGSPAYTAACRSLRSVPDDPAELSPDALYLAANMADMLVESRPIVCPPEQLSAIDDDIFPSFADVADYAAETELPFDSMLFDFTPPPGGSYPVVEVGGRPVVGTSEEGTKATWEIGGLLAGKAPGSDGHLFMPLFVDPDSGGVVPIGCALFRPNEPDPAPNPGRFIDDGYGLEMAAPVSFNGALVQASLQENGRPARGAYIGIGEINGDGDHEAAAGTQAVISAAAFRMAMKVLFLLDSVNIELDDVELSRQSRRQANRKSRPIASKIQIRRSKTRSTPSDDPQPAGYEHQFEVRGNFAHYGPGTKLYLQSDPVHIHPCPRCGTCRRIWRPPHIKGPADKPLVVKVRRVDLG